MNCEEYKKQCIEKAQAVRISKEKKIEDCLKKNFPLVTVAIKDNHHVAIICGDEFQILVDPHSDGSTAYSLLWPGSFLGEIRTEEDLGRYYLSKSQKVRFEPPKPERLNEADSVSQVTGRKAPWWKFWERL